MAPGDRQVQLLEGDLVAADRGPQHRLPLWPEMIRRPFESLAMQIHEPSSWRRPVWSRSISKPSGTWRASAAFGFLGSPARLKATQR